MSLSLFRFLSSGLITYDILAVSFFTVRKFIADHSLNILTQVIGVSFCFNAFITIGLMSLERYILFRCPNFYIRHFTCRRVKSATCLIWLASFTLYFYVRFGVCFMYSGGSTLHDVIGKCNQVTFTMYFCTIFVVLVISFICYWKIFRIVKSDHSIHNLNTHSLRQYRSSSLVFVYIITITLTCIGYIITIASNLERVALRLSNDFVNTFNSMVDPFVYILWYRECRMEMMKLFLCGNRSTRWNKRLEKMRIEIFDVVIMEPNGNPKGRRCTKTMFVGRNSEVDLNHSIHI